MIELVEEVDVAAPPEQVWRVVTDWPRQGEWMLGTTVRVASGDGRSAGSELAAFSGLGPFGFTDTMVITTWDPPHRCAVRHTGRLVRGTAEFTVRPGTVRPGTVRPGAAGAVVLWREALDLPFGVVGRLGWTLVRPAFRAGVRHSLRRLARLCEAAGPTT
ncbi:MAG: SRPBCC family protein [Micromonosporaceae bacterium]